MMVDINKMYQTRDGRAVRILCVDGPGEGVPVIGLVEGLPLDPLYWKADGQARRSETDLFLVDPPHFSNTETWAVGLEGFLKPVPVPTKHEGYAVIRDGKCEYGFYVFSTREVATKYLHRCEPDLPEGRHIVPVTWES